MNPLKIENAFSENLVPELLETGRSIGSEKFSSMEGSLQQNLLAQNPCPLVRAYCKGARMPGGIRVH